MIRGSEELLDWYAEKGVHFQPALSGTLSLSHSNAFFLGGGKALVNSLYHHAETSGVEILYDAEATGLEITDGCFKSASINMNGETQTITAKTVVIASGGFQSNEAWMVEAWGDAAKNFLIRGTAYNTGTMLKALMDGGAATVSDPTQCHAVAIDARGPKYDGGIVTRLDCVCYSIVVNTLGKRFYDEGEDYWPKRYAIWGRLIAQQPEQRAYAIVDDKVTHQYMPSLFPPMTANSLTELAEIIGIEGAVLEQTVASFNAAVQAGDYDPDTLDGCRTMGLQPDKSNWALALDTPPYSAFPLSPGITFTYLGVQVDDQARVVFTDTGSAANIFAAGEVMAGNILGQGYCAGTGMAIGGVFGRLAGHNAGATSVGGSS